MEGGPELDALVEEELMGGCAHQMSLVSPGVLPYGAFPRYECEKCGASRSLPGSGLRGWSTDIAAAWLLMDKMRTEDPFGIFPKFIDALAEMYDADQGDYRADLFNVLGNIDARAICVALLTAKGVEVESERAGE